MQIAGAICKVCGFSVVLASEGKFCPHCESVVHLACDTGETCAVCGQPYQAYERPEPNPLRDAILPRALRPARSGGPAFVIGVGIGLALVSVVMWFIVQYVLSHGH